MKIETDIFKYYKGTKDDFANWLNDQADSSKAILKKSIVFIHPDDFSVDGSTAAGYIYSFGHYYNCNGGSKYTAGDNYINIDEINSKISLDTSMLLKANDYSYKDLSTYLTFIDTSTDDKIVTKGYFRKYFEIEELIIE